MLFKIVHIVATAVRGKDESNKMAAENAKAVHITESILIVVFSLVRHSETHTKHTTRTKTHARLLTYELLKKDKKMPSKRTQLFIISEEIK